MKIFANEMLGQDEESSRKDSDMDSEKQDEQQVNVTVPTSDDHEELMRNFKSVANSTSSDLLQNVLRTSMCLEKADKGNIKDAVSSARKAKSLVGRWLERSPVAGKNNTGNMLPRENLIERDTVVMADVAVRRGGDSVKVSKQYRVVDIHDKYYNKWFMAKNPQKIFGKDSKYKLKVRMQEVSAVQEYSDVDLDDGRHKRADISRLLRDDEVKDVVGKLKRLA